MRGADALIHALQARGVKLVFALSGNQIMPVFDALVNSDIRLIHVRHEAATVYMAEAYAQITGKVGVALVTAGGGLGNVAGALIAARASDSQLVVLSGDSPTAADGRGAFQEMDQVALTQSLTKGSRRIMHADAIDEAVHWAMDLAGSNRTGPVHLALPADILTGQTGSSTALNHVTQADQSHNEHPSGSAQQVVTPGFSRTSAQSPSADLPVPEALYTAVQPLILLGPSLTPTRAPGLAQALRAKYQAPALAMQSPRGLNDPSLGRIADAARAADYVLCLGKCADFTLGFGGIQHWPNVRRWDLVVGDEAQRVLSQQNLGERLGFAVTADPLTYANSLASTAGSVAVTTKKIPQRSNWIAEVNTLVAARVEPEPSADQQITPHLLCQAVQKQLDRVDHATLICDGGEFGQWAQACLTGHQQIINGVSGVIGGGIGYAIGAKAANPESTIIALMGDGTVGFHLAEFETAIRENLPFVAVIGNDNRWNAEHLIQVRDFGTDRRIGCDLSDARYDLAVAALGGFGVFVAKEEELAAALLAAVHSQQAACVNVALSGWAAPTFT